MKIIYIGLFLNNSIKGTLEKQVENQHITLCFKPTNAQIQEVLEHLGKEYLLNVDGYGKNESNEGILVTEAKQLTYYHGALNPHVTISLSENGNPVDTCNIKFGALIDLMPKVISCRLGFFTSDGKVIYSI